MPETCAFQNGSEEYCSFRFDSKVNWVMLRFMSGDSLLRVHQYASKLSSNSPGSESYIKQRDIKKDKKVSGERKSERKVKRRDGEGERELK